MINRINLDWTTEPVKEEGFYYALKLGRKGALSPVVAYAKGINETYGKPNMVYGCCKYIGPHDTCTMEEPRVVPMAELFVMWARLPDAMQQEDYKK